MTYRQEVEAIIRRCGTAYNSGASFIAYLLNLSHYNSFVASGAGGVDEQSSVFDMTVIKIILSAGIRHYGQADNGAIIKLQWF